MPLLGAGCIRIRRGNAGPAVEFDLYWLPEGQEGLFMVMLRINGETKTIDAPSDMPLLWVLRDIVGLTGTKFGCGIAQCGACTVHVDGKPVRSCLLPVGSVGSRQD